MICRRRLIWLLLSLFVLSAAISARSSEKQFEAQSTALFRELAGTLEQMVLLRVPDDIAQDASVEVEGPSYKKSYNLADLEKLTTGTLEFNARLLLDLSDSSEGFLLPVPEIEQPTKVSIKVGKGRPTLRGNFVLEPRRKWEIYLIHHTHTDVGYTDIAERVRRQLAEQFRDVLSACRRTDDFPPEAQFHWTVEAFLPLEDFWREASESERAELLKYMREGRIEVTAAYVPHLSDIAGHESFLHFFRPAARFGEEHQVSVRSAMFSDSTGYAWIVPQILQSMGIRYLSTAVNPTRALNPFNELPRAIFWESPDGSRVLLWNSDPLMAYPEGYHLRLAYDYRAALPFVTAYLEKLRQTGYAFPELGLRVAGDNLGPMVSISETVRDWNARWKYPRLIFSTNYQFLHTLEGRHSPDIPVYRAAWPDWWSDLYLCGAQATGVLRLGHEWLTAAEKLYALARLAGKDIRLAESSLEVARQRTLLADEPVWGYAFAVDRPHDWRTGGGSSEKVNDVYTAAVNAQAVAKAAAQTLFAEWLDARTIVVFNPLGWPRDGTVQLDLPRGYGPAWSGLAATRGVRDSETGDVFPLQLLHADGVSTVLEFSGRNVPPMGYRTYELVENVPSQGGLADVQIDDHTLENEFYRIRLDEEQGTIASIFDKELKRELVDSSSSYGFNQYIYERPPGGDFRHVWGDMWWLDTIRNRDWLKPPEVERFESGACKLKDGRKGPVSFSLVLECSAKMTPLVRQEIILHPSVKRIDIENTIQKEKVLTAEAAYFAFPFAMRNPAVRYEGANTIITPETGQLPRSARDWYAVQHWVKLSDDTFDIVWTPLEAPVVQFGAIRTGQWQKKLTITNGSLYSFLISNYWMTDMQPSQGGEMIFRYSFTSQNHAPNDISATRFGWNQMTPFVVAGPLNHPSPYLPPPAAPQPGPERKSQGTFCEISEPNVLLISFRAADHGRGNVLRLLEFSGKATQTTVRLGPRAISKVASLSAAEQAPGSTGGPVTKAGEATIQVSLKPFELRTLHLEFEK